MLAQQYLFLGFLSQTLETRMSKRCLFLSLWLQGKSWGLEERECEPPTQEKKYHMQETGLLLQCLSFPLRMYPYRPTNTGYQRSNSTA